MGAILDHLAALGADAAFIAPRLAGAVCFLLVGALAAWVLDRVLASACGRLGLDGSSAGLRLAHLAGLAGLHTSPSVTLRRLVRWTLIVVAAAQAALILELEAVASVIDRAVWVAPTLVMVLAVLYVGAVLAERLARAAQAAAERDDTLPPALVATVVRGAVLAAGLLLALEAAGVHADLPVVVLSICLAGALGLVVAGLVIGSRGLLENLLAARYVEEQYIEGQMVSFRSERAQIRSIGLMATVVRTGDGVDHTTPNAMFLRESI